MTVVKKVKKLPATKLKAVAKTEKVEPAKVEKIVYNSNIKEYAWLSNFQPCLVVLRIDKDTGENLMFTSAEAAFHYFKTKSVEYRTKIYNCIKAYDARYQGSAKAGCPMRKDWHEIRRDVMFRVVLAKYSQNTMLAKWLLETGDAELVELAPWDKEGFWGTDESGKGNNESGKITMEVREILRDRKIGSVAIGKYL